MWYVTMFTVAPWDGFHPGSKTITNNHRQDCRVTHWVDCECDYQTANGMSPIRSRWPFAGHTLENSSHCPGTSAQAVDSPGLAIDHTMISWFPWASCFFMFFPWSFSIHKWWKKVSHMITNWPNTWSCWQNQIGI
jgi:hypothetical protein